MYAPKKVSPGCASAVAAITGVALRTVTPLLGAIMLSVALVSASYAAVLDVCSTCTYTTIQDALNAASSGDTINILDAVQNESGITVDKNLTIQGHALRRAS